MAVSFNNLGSYGRLGNQMFQYASLRGITLRNGLRAMVPPPDTKTSDNYGLFECFEMTDDLEFGHQNNVPRLDVNQFHFSKEVYYACPDNVDLLGYLQTEKYFIKYWQDIKKEFTFKESIIDRVSSKYSYLLDDRPIFLHVRRGDPNLWWAYTNLPNHHPTCTEDYYIKALSYFSDDTRVIVISDSIDWCKEQEWLTGSRFVFSDESDNKFSDGASVPYYDLALMSLCSGGIIANSSLSWWGAWLMDNAFKGVVSPDPNKWFGSALDHYVMDDLIPERWSVA